MLEHGIACRVAKLVVDALEVVQIHDQQARSGGHARSTCEFLLGDLDEFAPVVQARQRVTLGQGLQRLLLLLQGGVGGLQLTLQQDLGHILVPHHHRDELNHQQRGNGLYEHA